MASSAYEWAKQRAQGQGSGGQQTDSVSPTYLWAAQRAEQMGIRERMEKERKEQAEREKKQRKKKRRSRAAQNFISQPGLAPVTPDDSGLTSFVAGPTVQELRNKQQTQRRRKSQQDVGLLESTPILGRIGRGYAQGISEITGSQDETNEGIQKADESRFNTVMEVLRNPDVDDEKKREFAQIAQKIAGEASGDAQARMQRQLDDADVRKFIAASAELGLLAATGGASRLAGLTKAAPSFTAKAGVSGARTGRLGRNVVQSTGRMRNMTGRQLGRATGVLGAEGGAGGALDYLSRADDPTLKGGLLSTAAGASLGGSIPGAGKLAGRGLDAQAANRAARAADKLAKANQPKVDNVFQAAAKDSKTLNRVLSTTPVQKAQTVVKEAQKKFQSRLAPLNRMADNMVKAGHISRGRANDVKSQIQTASLSSGAISESWMKGSGWDTGVRSIPGSEYAPKAFAPLDGKALNPAKPSQKEAKLYEYLAADNEASQMAARQARGEKIDTNRLSQLRAKAKRLETPEHKERLNAQYRAYDELGDIMVSEGIVSQADMNYWRKTNQSYARIQRVVDDMSEASGRSSGKSVASRGSTVAEQKTKGSTREVVNPLLTMVDYSNSVFKEITSNRAANSFIEALSDSGLLGKQLRGAENVAVREGLKEALAYSKPLQKQMEKLVKGQSKYVRRIQKEIRQIQGEAKEEVSRKLRQATKGELVKPTDAGEVPAENIRAVIEEILSTDTATLNRINKKFLNREPKLAQAIDELTDMQEVLKGVRAQRKQMVDEVASRADKKIQNAPTLQRRVNGIKEVYETTPEIEVAAKSMGSVELGAWARAISAPVRFMQSTITGGLNPAWVAYSLSRDLLEGTVLSSSARVTHHPGNLIGAFADMTGAKNKELFNRFMASEKGASALVDLTKSAKDNARSIRELSRASLPAHKRAGTVIKTPRDWYQTIQDASRWNEHYTKYVGFRGMYNDLIKQNVPESEAFQRALWEARNVSGNLLETGDWSKHMAAIFPYFNPAIQGGASLAKAFKTRPGATSAKVLAGIQMPAAMATAWNMSDPRRAEIYLDLSESERERFTIAVLPGTEKNNGEWGVFKIPKAPGVGSLANPVEKLMINMYGEDPGEFENFAQSIMKSAGMPFDVSSPQAFAGSATPFQVKVPTEQIINYSFYKGEQIVPDWMIEENPDEPFKRHYGNSSKSANAIAKALDVSPLMVRNFMNNTTGEFGKNVTYLSDVAQDYAQLGEGEVGGRSPLKSLTRGYFGAYGGRADRKAGEEASSLIDSYRPTSSKVTDLVKSNKMDEANRRAREHNEKIEGLLERVSSRPEFIDMSDAQRDYLEQLKFPMDGNRLSDRSIQSRKNQ